MNRAFLASILALMMVMSSHRPGQTHPSTADQHAETESPSIIPPIAVSAATVGLVVAALWSRSVAHDRATLAEFALTKDAYEDDKSSIGTYNLVFVTTGSLAILGAAASGYLWYRATRSTETQLQVNARTDGATLGIHGRF